MLRAVQCSARLCWVQLNISDLAALHPLWNSGVNGVRDRQQQPHTSGCQLAGHAVGVQWHLHVLRSAAGSNLKRPARRSWPPAAHRIAVPALCGTCHMLHVTCAGVSDKRRLAQPIGSCCAQGCCACPVRHLSHAAWCVCRRERQEEASAAYGQLLRTELLGLPSALNSPMTSPMDRPPNNGTGAIDLLKSPGRSGRDSLVFNN